MALEFFLLAAFLLLITFIILNYNRLTFLRLRVRNSWAQVDVQLKRRYDLIPGLMETVKGYARYEKEILIKITKYRSMLVVGDVGQKADANNLMSNTLKSIFAVSENYPKLKADKNFLSIQEDLADTENKIAYARSAYNDDVLEFNTAVQLFPSNIIAGFFGFSKEQFFTVNKEEE